MKYIIGWFLSITIVVLAIYWQPVQKPQIDLSNIEAARVAPIVQRKTLFETTLPFIDMGELVIVNLPDDQWKVLTNEYAIHINTNHLKFFKR